MANVIRQSAAGNSFRKTVGPNRKDAILFCFGNILPASIDGVTVVHPSMPAEFAVDAPAPVLMVIVLGNLLQLELFASAAISHLELVA